MRDQTYCPRNARFGSFIKFQLNMRARVFVPSLWCPLSSEGDTAHIKEVSPMRHHSGPEERDCPKLVNVCGTCFSVEVVRSDEMSCLLSIRLSPMQESQWADSTEMSHAINPMTTLTAREREVASLVAKGLTNKQIAEMLFVSLSTVKSHVRSALDKTGSPNRAALSAYAQREGLSPDLGKAN
jgi:DNA-binding CsgD family transcriptional regulator